MGENNISFKKEYDSIVTYHDSCSGLRELGIKAQPRNLISKIPKLALVESKEAETCCGFGGLFCIKYPDISENIVDSKIDDILKSGASKVIGGDLGCLINISGRMSRRGKEIDVMHIAELSAEDSISAVKSTYKKV